MTMWNRHSGLDPESPRTLRDDPFLRHAKGILNQVQDDGGATACAASLHSDRSGSDATNDKQLSLASRVSHSGLDPESPQMPTPPRRVDLSTTTITPHARSVNRPYDDTLPLQTAMRYNHLQNLPSSILHHPSKTKGFAHA